MPELNVILLGPPGSGKGTQGETLREDLRLPYYATGDILRAAVKGGTALGRKAQEYMDAGDLVPDEVIIGVIGERVQAEEAADGFILDGFPRTVPQAEALDEEMEDLGRGLTVAILIDVSAEEVVRRLGGRRTCEQNGHVFHVDFNPPAEAGVCDVDGSPLIVRDDDEPGLIVHRLEQYNEKTAPLVSYYEDTGILRRVEGENPPEVVTERIRGLIATLRREEEIWWLVNLRLPAELDASDVVFREMIILKTPGQVEAMAAAGEIHARCLRMLIGKCRPGVTTAELDEAAERFIVSQGAEPSFKGYRGFPGSICTSPNSMVVHGIPGPTELERGDILSLDVGVTYRGWVVDGAATVPIGEPSEEAVLLLKSTRAALDDAVAQARPGNRLGDVSHAVQSRIDRDGFSVIRSLVGHGIGRDMHEDPQIPNYGDPGEGPMLEEGMVLAIEPMVNAGGPDVKMGKDGWAVYSVDDSLAAHFEFTIAVTADDPRVLTPWDDSAGSPL